MLKPRWDYPGSWDESKVFLGGTEVFDIYVDTEGILRLVCGPANNDNWHWVCGAEVGRAYPSEWGTPSDHWLTLFYQDWKNVDAYLTCFAPDWYERGRNIFKRGEQHA